MPAAPATARTIAVPAAEHSARVELLERLLDSGNDVSRCARAGVEWLARHAGVRRALCLMLDRQARVLTSVAWRGLPDDVEAFTIPLADPADPLVAAWRTDQPVVFERRDRRAFPSSVPDTPLGRRALTAVSLGRHPDRGAVGLLLLGTAGVPNDEAAWLISVLGRKLEQVFDAPGPAPREGLAQRRERALLASIINAVTDPILLTDIDGRLVVANSRAEALFSASEDESPGRQRAVELNNMLFAAALSWQAFTGATTPRELLLADPVDGSDLLFEVFSTTVEDAREGSGVVSVLRNVTDLRSATEEIEEQYRKLRTAESDVRAERDRLTRIIDSVADPIVVTDQAGATIRTNRLADELFTAPPDAPDAVQRAVHSNDAKFSSFISSLVLGGAAAGETQRGELSLLHPVTRESIPMEAVAGTVEAGRFGDPSVVVTVLHDRRQAIERERLFEQAKAASTELQSRVRAATAELASQNELLRRQALELQQASRLKSLFLANMSHEFRTPLNAIIGYTQMMQEGVGGQVPPGVARHLQRIASNSSHLLSVINEILDITRIEAGKMPIQIREFDLNEVVAEVVAELDPVIAQTPLEVTVLPARAMPRLRSDRQKVKQIVVNLMSNALKFTHEGGVTVRVSHQPSRKLATVSVRDSGIGVAPEHHQVIFEDFRQVDDSLTRPYMGTGLGLAICRRLASALGGRIRLRSELGAGSTFTLSLPLELKA